MEENRPSIIVAADVVLFAVDQKALHVLLVQRGRPPFEGMWAFPGGMVEPEEDLMEAACRELAEETGIKDVPYITQLGAFGKPGRDPRGRVISVAYIGLLGRLEAVQGADDAARAGWWPVNNLPPLAFDHHDILTCALKRLRDMVEQDMRLIFHLVPIPFVMSELRHAYEAVIGREVDKRNFRRFVLQHGWVKPGNVRVNRGRGRPAREYYPKQEALISPPHHLCC